VSANTASFIRRCARRKYINWITTSKWWSISPLNQEKYDITNKLNNPGRFVIVHRILNSDAHKVFRAVTLTQPFLTTRLHQIIMHHFSYSRQVLYMKFNSSLERNLCFFLSARYTVSWIKNSSGEKHVFHICTHPWQREMLYVLSSEKYWSPKMPAKWRQTVPSLVKIYTQIETNSLSILQQNMWENVSFQQCLLPCVVEWRKIVYQTFYRLRSMKRAGKFDAVTTKSVSIWPREKKNWSTRTVWKTRALFEVPRSPCSIRCAVWKPWKANRREVSRYRLAIKPRVCQKLCHSAVWIHEENSSILLEARPWIGQSVCCR
jgi:hypothetical protein